MVIAASASELVQRNNNLKFFMTNQRETQVHQSLLMCNSIELVQSWMAQVVRLMSISTVDELFSHIPFLCLDEF